MQIEILHKLFEKTFAEPVLTVHPIALTVSSRRKIRLCGATKTTIGVYSPSPQETAAFLGFAEHFRSKGIRVPEIMARDGAYYLEEDLGTKTLFQLAAESTKLHGAPDTPTLELYRQALTDLVKLQFQTLDGFPLNLCTPRKDFDRQSLSWDLNYFKYHFLMLAEIEFDEQALENDFDKLLAYLPTNCESFMHRDYQSRNLLVRDGQIHIIDFQGGRRGMPEYDVASILYQRGVTLSDTFRDELSQLYFDNAAQYLGYSQDVFRDRLSFARLIRTLQTFGTRGRRGLFQGNTELISSITDSVEELQRSMQVKAKSLSLPEIERIAKLLPSRFTRPVAQPGLEVSICSFSYRRSPPRHNNIHGGGYVFDCRSLPNPHLDKTLRDFNGTQPEIQNNLNALPVVQEFKEHVLGIIDGTVERYLANKYNALSIDFGCTGGKHRSVYMAESLAIRLEERFKGRGVRVLVKHRELGIQR